MVKMTLKRWIMIFLPIGLTVGGFLLGWLIRDFKLGFTWMLILGVGSLCGELVINGLLTKNRNQWIAGILIAGFSVALIIYGVYIGVLGTIFPPAPVTPPEEIGRDNCTISVYNSQGNAIITGFTEVRIWQTYNYTNASTWSIIDISQNWSATEFWHDGWLNTWFVNYNLTGYDALSRPVFYYAELRAWWLLEEWMNEDYTPPNWWAWSEVNMTRDNASIRVFIEENETCDTWQQVWNGNMEITLISEPYTSYFSMINTYTLERWNNTDSAYADGYTDNFKVDIKNPVNETTRGYSATFNYSKGEWYGCWIIASSDNDSNIYNNYTDVFGTDYVRWFNVTKGMQYVGVIFDDGITSVATYDCALLLDTFSWDVTFYADISITNGSAGIHFFLGKGYESDIQIMRAL